MTAKSRSAKYYATHPEARKKKAEYDNEFAKKPEQRKKQAELKREARKRGIYGKRKAMGKDLAHTKDGLKLKSVSANRGSKTDQAGDRRARG